jgi:hypothetical protein
MVSEKTRRTRRNETTSFLVILIHRKTEMKDGPRKDSFWRHSACPQK